MRMPTDDKGLAAVPKVGVFVLSCQLAQLTQDTREGVGVRLKTEHQQVKSDFCYSEVDGTLSQEEECTGKEHRL